MTLVMRGLEADDREAWLRFVADVPRGDERFLKEDLADLANFERGVFGTDPSTLLHQLLGTGVSAQVLSTVYLLFLTFVPISVGVTLVWFNNRAGALWWVSVLSINWVIGALSYFVLPRWARRSPSRGCSARCPTPGRRCSSTACSRNGGRSWATPSGAASCRASRRSPRCTSRSCSPAR